MEKESLRDLVEQGLSINGIAAKTRLGPATIRYWLNKFKLKTNFSPPKALYSYDWIQIQRDYDEGLTWERLSEKYKLSTYMITKAIEDKLFESRNPSMAAKLAHQQGRHDYSYSRTPEFREKYRKFGGLKSKSGRCKMYPYANLNSEEFSLQGRWELILAQSLNSINMLWVKNKKYFVYTFEQRERKYYPDFYLPSLDLYIEVKGYETDKDRAKWKAFPHQLIICRKKDVKDIGDFVSKLTTHSCCDPTMTS